MADYGLILFQEDLASDMRSSWNDLLAASVSPEEATARIQAEFAESSQDVDEVTAFWLALAALQERSAGLQPAVRDKALAIIDSGQDLKRWTDERDREQRAFQLQQLRASLLNPRLKPLRVRRKFVHSTQLEAGDIFSYRRSNGSLALFRVNEIEMEKSGDRSPFVELLDHDGQALLASLDLSDLPGKPSPWPPRSGWERDRTLGYLLLDEPGNPEPQNHITTLVKGLASREFQTYRGPYMLYVHWKDLDETLDGVFGSARSPK